MTKRSYKQNCALALTTDVIGERWSLLLIRDLLVGPRRFRDLLHSLQGIGTNLLSSRLTQLQEEDIIRQQALESGAHAYALTGKGRALQPALAALIRWGLEYGPQNKEDFHHEDEWDLVALQALFQPDLAQRLTVRIQFNSEKLLAWMSVDEQQMSMGLGEIDAPNIVVNGTVRDLFVDSADPETLCVSGSGKLLKQTMAAFALRSEAT